MKFNLRVFVCFCLCLFGIICFMTALVAACEARSYVMMFSTTPGIAITAAGFALLE